MRIDFVNNNLYLGGAETVVRQLHEGFLSENIQCRLWISDFRTLPYKKKLKPLYPRLFARFDHTRFNSLVNKWVPKKEFSDHRFRKLAENNSDIINIHSFHGTYATIESLAYLASQKPVVWTFHRFWGITGGCDHPGDCMRHLTGCGQCPRVDEWPICGVDNTAEQWEKKFRLLKDLPLTIVAPSRHLAEKVQSSPIGKNWDVQVIYNGVDTNKFTNNADIQLPSSQKEEPATQNKKVLIVNRDFKDGTKGFDIIQQALSAVNLPDTQFYLAGRNAEWASSMLSRLNCVALGFVEREQLIQYYATADVLLYASPGENFPCVIIEAMASKCCVVSTPTDGVLEQITSGKDGLIAKTMDPKDLATKLVEALKNDHLRISLAATARETACNAFSENKMITDYLSLFEKILTKS